MEQALEAADEELLVDDHDDAGQQQLDQGHRDVVAVKPGGQGPAPHHVSHGEVHQHQQKAQGGNQPPPEFGGLVVGQGFQAASGEGAAAAPAFCLGLAP